MEKNIYESDELVNQYLAFHYAEGKAILPWETGPVNGLRFPERCVEEGVDRARLGDGPLRALDVGCSVGRSSFSLASFCETVIGIDYSAAFVAAANEMLRVDELTIELLRTGTMTEVVTIKAPEVDAGRLSFEKGDAQDLREDLGSFDIVLAANLLCRLGQPLKFLNRLAELVKPGGQLVITTPNTWLESFTAKAFWLGATPETGEPLEALREVLLPEFDFDETWDMPFLIREHERKYQWSVAQASRWIRK